MDKITNYDQQNTTQKTKYRITQSPKKTGGLFSCAPEVVPAPLVALVLKYLLVAIPWALL